TVLAASFTRLPEHRWRRFQDHLTRELAWFRGRESGERGDTLLASFDGPARAIKCALAITHHAEKLGIRVTAGLHTGECEAVSEGILGAAVYTARQIADYAGEGEIVVSSTVRDLV